MITSETPLANGSGLTVLHTSFYLPNGDGIVVYRDRDGCVSDRGTFATYVRQRPMRFTKKRAAIVQRLADMNGCKFDPATWHLSQLEPDDIETRMAAIIATTLQAAAILSS